MKVSIKAAINWPRFRAWKRSWFSLNRLTMGRRRLHAHLS
jgi:hypothetical protein